MRPTHTRSVDGIWDEPYHGHKTEDGHCPPKSLRHSLRDIGCDCGKVTHKVVQRLSATCTKRGNDPHPPGINTAPPPNNTRWGAVGFCLGCGVWGGGWRAPDLWPRLGMALKAKGMGALWRMGLGVLLSLAFFPPLDSLRASSHTRTTL